MVYRNSCIPPPGPNSPLEFIVILLPPVWVIVTLVPAVNWTVESNPEVASNVKSILNYITSSDLESFNGSTNIVELGTITSGTWEGTKITDAYINSAAIWNGKQNALTFGISDTNSIVVDGSASNGEFARFTANGLEGRTLSELKNDLALTHSDIDLSTYSGSSSINTTGTITSGTWQGSTINESYIDNSIARKTYVDSVAQGLDIKDAVKVTTTANNDRGKNTFQPSLINW